MLEASGYTDNSWAWFYYDGPNTRKMDIMDNSENEYKVTYRNKDSSFSIILRPKKYPIGFHAKF